MKNNLIGIFTYIFGALFIFFIGAAIGMPSSFNFIIAISSGITMVWLLWKLDF